MTEELTVKREEVGALDGIERPQEHDNDDIYKDALNIIETLFKDEEEDGDENDFALYFSVRLKTCMFT